MAEILNKTLELPVAATKVSETTQVMCVFLINFLAVCYKRPGQFTSVVSRCCKSSLILRMFCR